MGSPRTTDVVISADRMEPHRFPGRWSMAEAVGVRVMRLDARRDHLVAYVAWKLNVGRLMRTLRAIGGIGEGTPYLLDVLNAERDIVDDAPLTSAGVRYLRTKKMLVREREVAHG